MWCELHIWSKVPKTLQETFQKKIFIPNVTFDLTPFIHNRFLRFLLLQGIASFIQLARKSGVCIAVSVTINRNADDEEFDDVVRTLLNNDKARVSEQH